MRRFLALVTAGVLLCAASARAQDDQAASFKEAQDLMKEALQAKVAAERSVLEARQKLEQALSALKGLQTLSPNWNADEVSRSAGDCARALASLTGDSGRAAGAASKYASTNALFIGNKKTKKYHKADCRFAANLSERGRVTFMNCEEAVDAGYTACKTCKPEEAATARPGAGAAKSPSYGGGDENAAAATGPFFGIASSKKLHKSDGRCAKRVADKNKVFFQSYADAVKEGYAPCKLCKPDEASGATAAAPAPEAKPTAEAPAIAAPAAAPAPAAWQFCASTNGKTFHRADCAWAKGIDPSALVTYKTRDEAIAAGKKPCRICKP